MEREPMAAALSPADQAEFLHARPAAGQRPAGALTAP
jgi:hypothetical protein